MQFSENVQDNWQEGYCFIMTVPDPIQPEQPRRELENLRYELLEHPPYSPDLALGDFLLFGPLKTTLVADVSLVTKRLEQRCGSG
jgi:hypothetical protein